MRTAHHIAMRKGIDAAIQGAKRKLSVREALATLITQAEWYEWLWGASPLAEWPGDTPPDKAIPHTEGAQGDTT